MRLAQRSKLAYGVSSFPFGCRHSGLTRSAAAFITKAAFMNNSDSTLTRLYKLVVVGPSIYSRIFWFILGGPLSIGINWTIFYLTHHRLGLSEGVALLISLTTVTLIFSLWNYFLNFRTSRNWGECLPRYIAALGCCYAINYLITLTGIKQFAHDLKLLQFGVMVGSTFLVSGFKFLLYHYWVYPHTPASDAAIEAIES
jgi:putative flippase GtrA